MYKNSEGKLDGIEIEIFDYQIGKINTSLHF